MQKRLIEIIASAVQQRLNCIETNNTLWRDRTEYRLEALARCLPSGSGIDCGTKIDLDKSTSDRIVLFAEYHHMNEGGLL